jgi:hypothetical protein
MRGHEVDDRLVDAFAVLASGLCHESTIVKEGDAIKGLDSKELS